MSLNKMKMGKWLSFKLKFYFNLFFNLRNSKKNVQFFYNKINLKQ